MRRNNGAILIGWDSNPKPPSWFLGQCSINWYNNYVHVELLTEPAKQLGRLYVYTCEIDSAMLHMSDI